MSRACAAYCVGVPRSFSVVPTGYEDCNLSVATDRGRYLVKIFSKHRTQADVVRYGTVLEEATRAGVNIPRLHRTIEGNLVFRDDLASGVSMVVMDYVSGHTFLELDRPPNPVERRAVIAQAALIHRIPVQLPFAFDWWAIPNVHHLYDSVSSVLSSDERLLVAPILDRFDALSVAGLPHCFVHGDMSKANVIRGDDDRIYVLDFSVSNWYPRILELAVICSNLLQGFATGTNLRRLTEVVASEYTDHAVLTELERGCLYDFAVTGVAVEFLGSCREKYLCGNASPETEYWMKQARQGLHQLAME